MYVCMYIYIYIYIAYRRDSIPIICCMHITHNTNNIASRRERGPLRGRSRPIIIIVISMIILIIIDSGIIVTSIIMIIIIIIMIIIGC